MLRSFAASGLPVRIAGDGPLRERVVGYSRQYQNIEFLGALNKREVINEMAGCTALIFPSVWFEGMPLTIIEAFSCGTPVIASGIGVMENMIIPRYNGLHFEAGNESDLVDKVMEWHQLPDSSKAAYSKNAFDTYEHHYTPGKNAEQLLDIYSEVVPVPEPVVAKSFSY